MFPFNELRQVQIEITNRCQASCPMCDRNVNGGINNPNLKINDWTLENFKKIFDITVLNQIQKIDFCGVFGEPTMNNELINMCQYVKDTNPNVHISIYTNGSVRNVDWWIELRNALPDNHKVEFAIDGLIDTHHLYRIGTSFSKIMDNASAFINAGGKAHWMFLQFRHNQHQVNDARVLADSMKFEKFTVKNSKRFSGKFTVLDRQGKYSHTIEQPQETIVKLVRKTDLTNFKDWKNAEKVNCMVFNDREVYIDAHYTMLPCCMLASFLYSTYDKELYQTYNVYDESITVDAGVVAQQGVNKLISELGGLSQLDTVNLGINYILSTYIWQELWKHKWQEKSSPACIMLCSQASPFTSVEGQKHVSV